MFVIENKLLNGGKGACFNIFWISEQEIKENREEKMGTAKNHFDLFTLVLIKCNIQDTFASLWIEEITNSYNKAILKKMWFEE